MARTFIVVAAVAVAVIFAAVNVSAASQDMILHRRKSAPQEKSDAKCECPRYECPNTSLYRMVNDAISQHPWLTVPFMALCWIIKVNTGVFGEYAIGYVVYPIWVSMRVYERYSMFSS